MKKSIENLAVGDWVVMDSILLDAFCGRPVEVKKIMGTMFDFLEAPRRTDREDDRRGGRKAKKAIRLVFDNYEEANAVHEFAHSEFWKMNDEMKALTRAYHESCYSFADTFKEPKK